MNYETEFMANINSLNCHYAQSNWATPATWPFSYNWSHCFNYGSAAREVNGCSQSRPDGLDGPVTSVGWAVRCGAGLCLFWRWQFLVYELVPCSLSRQTLIRDCIKTAPPTPIFHPPTPATLPMCVLTTTYPHCVQATAVCKTIGLLFYRVLSHKTINWRPLALPGHLWWRVWWRAALSESTGVQSFFVCVCGVNARTCLRSMWGVNEYRWQ